MKNSIAKVTDNRVSRTEFVTLLKVALSNTEERTALQNAIYLCLIGPCALRNFEAMVVQVSDFILDEHLMLADMGHGYGRLTIPAYKTNRSSLTGGRDCDVPVIPRVRELINNYLKSVMMSGYNQDTFLMRRLPLSETDKLVENVTLESFKDEKWTFSVGIRGKDIIRRLLTNASPLLEQKKCLTSYDFRRSFFRLVVETPLPVSIKHLEARRIEAADIFARRPTCYINYKYHSPLDTTEFITILDNALNFPLGVNELEQWEEARRALN